MTRRYNYTKGTEYAAYAPLRRAFDITPVELDSNNNPTLLSLETRAIMVTAECTVTGILANEETEHTTATLTPGILYPFAFKAITAVSAGSVKGYA